MHGSYFMGTYLYVLKKNSIGGVIEPCAYSSLLQRPLSEWSSPQDAGGCLHTRSETYKALKTMMASLGDRYTEFLLPSQVPQGQHTLLSY